MQNTITFNPPISISLKYKFNLKLFLVIASAFIVGLLFFYIFQINEMIKENYSIKDYEANLNGLWQENKILENNLLKSNSLGNIESLAKNLNFEKVGDIKYIQIMGSSVVAK